MRSSDAGDSQLHVELWPAASGGPWRLAARAGDGWRGHSEGGSAHWPAAPRDRKARRVEALQSVDRLHGPPRLRIDDVQRARLCACDRAAAWHYTPRAVSYTHLRAHET